MFRMLSNKRVALLFAPILLLLASKQHIQSAQAILNCFNPNMFKMHKAPGGINPLAYNSGERANWYPQQQQQQQHHYNHQQQVPYQVGYPPAYGQHPMKMFFQPKWKGSSLFGGSKGGWNNWKMGANSNFYRPGYGYPSTAGAYSFNDQLQVAPFAIPPQLSSPYTSSQDGGWSAPIGGYSSQLLSPTSGPIQQTQLSSYDTYGGGGSQLIQPKPQQIVSPSTLDPYGGTKGGGGGGSTTASNLAANKLYTTTKNILLADGGYNLYDSHLYGGALRDQSSYGYAYPEWYSGVVDSPAKIAQQLVKYGLRKQRAQLNYNKSAPLIQQQQQQVIGGANQFTMLDEPRFVGFGTVEDIGNREVRLSCAFNEAIDQTNRPLWIKFLEPYNSTQGGINSKVVPPFNCPNSQCRTQEIEATKDYRYKFDNGPATSTLIIADPRLSDYGTYRCSALTKTINNNPLETIYQIVRLGNLKL